MNGLKSDVSSLNGKVEDMQICRLGGKEQYSRRNCVLLHRLKENNENTDNLALRVIIEKLDMSDNESKETEAKRLGTLTNKNSYTLETGKVKQCKARIWFLQHMDNWRQDWLSCQRFYKY